jgi:lysophospholipase L1-like esterase
MTLIIAAGDSTTAGTPGFTPPIEAPPDGAGNVESQFAHWLMQQHPEWRVLNRGVDGERSDQIRARFVRDVSALKPDAAIVLAGVNDIYQGRSADAVTRELDAMYAAARLARVPVVAATIIPYDTATEDQNARMHVVNDWIRARADGRTSWMAVADTRSAVASPENPDRLVSSPDGLHPSPEGYRLMALALEPVLVGLLSER